MQIDLSQSSIKHKAHSAKQYAQLVRIHRFYPDCSSFLWNRNRNSIDFHATGVTKWEEASPHTSNAKGGYLQGDWPTVMKLVRFLNRCDLTSSEGFKPQLGLVVIWETVFFVCGITLSYCNYLKLAYFIAQRIQITTGQEKPTL